MKFLPLLFASFGLISPAFAAPVVQSGDVVAVCGDSLTEQGDYSIDIEDYLLMCAPVTNIKTVQFGDSGGTIPSLLSHIDLNVLTLSPQVATIEYGVNDNGLHTLTPDIINKYSTSLATLIKKLQAAGTRTVIVGAPAIVDTFYFKNPKYPEINATIYNETLGQQGKIGQQVAEANGAIFADMHTPLMLAMEKSKAAYGEKYPFSSNVDGMHGGANEHLVIAYAFLKAMGFDGNIGTITYDAANGTTEASTGQRVISSGNGKVVIESSRYPFCFFHGMLDPDLQDAPADFMGSFGNGDAAILPFVPFNQDLNRYTLIVKNLKSPKAKITWGDQSKEFTAAELAQGINLAAEFLKNPFVPAFGAITKQIEDKQTFETMYLKGILQNQKSLLDQAPGHQTDFDSVHAGFRNIHMAILDNLQNAVKPVTHTITIEESQ